MAFRQIVKDNKPKIQLKDVSKTVLKKHKPKDYRREGILKKARKKAHLSTADAKRNISNELRND